MTLKSAPPKRKGLDLRVQPELCARRKPVITGRRALSKYCLFQTLEDPVGEGVTEGMYPHARTPLKVAQNRASATLHLPLTPAVVPGSFG
jgi:hypothetical protein